MFIDGAAVPLADFCLNWRLAAVRASARRYVQCSQASAQRLETVLHSPPSCPSAGHRVRTRTDALAICVALRTVWVTGPRLWSAEPAPEALRPRPSWRVSNSDPWLVSMAPPQPRGGRRGTGPSAQIGPGSQQNNRNDHTRHVGEDFDGVEDEQLVRRYALRAVAKHLHSRVEARTRGGVPLGQAGQVVGDESFDDGSTGCATNRLRLDDGQSGVFPAPPSSRVSEGNPAVSSAFPR